MTFKPWYLAPVIVAAALGACAQWWMQEGERWDPPRAKRPELPKLDDLPQPQNTRALQAEKRPVMWSSRRPPVKEEKQDNRLRELSEARLTAVLESGNDRIALLQKTDGSLLKITGTTSPWRLVSFDGRNAVFNMEGGREVTRPLDPGAAKVGPRPMGGPPPGPR